MLTLTVTPIPSELTQGCQFICLCYWELGKKLWIVLADHPGFYRLCGLWLPLFFLSPSLPNFFHLLQQYCSSILLPLSWASLLHFYNLNFSIDSGSQFLHPPDPSTCPTLTVCSSRGGIWIYCTPATLQQLPKCHPLGDICKTLSLSLKWLLSFHWREKHGEILKMESFPEMHSKWPLPFLTQRMNR